MARIFQRLFWKGLGAGKVVCIGLDSDPGKLPILHLGLNYPHEELQAAQAEYLRAQAAKPGSPEARLRDKTCRILAKAQLAFNVAIIDETKDIVLAYKPNSAFYEALGHEGLRALRRTVEYINKVAPNVVVILDAKRGDIDSTNDGYVAYAFNYLGVDAITVSPYLGGQALKPFLDCKDKGIIVLAVTSNRGQDEFQNLTVPAEGDYPEEPLYMRVTRRVAGHWNSNSNCLLVVGATHPPEAANVRGATDLGFLIPGLGKQAGDLGGTVLACRSVDGALDALVNNSRAIIFASNGKGFAKAARREALKMHNAITAVPQTA